MLRNLKSRLRDTRVILAAIFFSYLLLFAIANWTAVTNAWWYVDDFPRAEQISDSIQRGLINGRPFEGLWFLTFLFDATPQDQVQNILLRAIQVGFHSLAAFVAALVIWKQTHRWTAFAAVIPFLLWPFNGEAVLWRTAGSYPIAAFESICAVGLVRSAKPGQWLSRVAGVLLLAIAVLTNQLAAMAGLGLWLIVAMVYLLETYGVAANLWRDAYALFAGYLVGGILSYLLARSFDPTTRSTVSVDLAGKLAYLFDLNRLFLTKPDFYYGWLVGIQIFLLAFAFVLLFVYAFKKKYRINKAFAVSLLLIALCVIPYAPLLIVAENWPAFRVMYVAPFLICGAWLLIDETLEGLAKSRMAVLLLLIILLIGYTRIAQTNSSEYVAVFKSDLQVLHSIELAANKDRLNQVYVATWPENEIPNWNPYGVTYMYLDSKLSAFLKDYSSDAFIRLFSNLLPVDDGNLKSECMSYCPTGSSSGPFQIQEVGAPQGICVCGK